VAHALLCSGRYMKSLLLLGFVAMTACGSPCAEGVCSNEGYSRVQPGPCTSGHSDGDSGTHCQYTYDNGKVVQVACSWHASDPDRDGTDSAAYSYDAAGNLASIHSVREGGGEHRDMTWVFDAEHVTSTDVDHSDGTSVSTDIRTYDRATFQFLPDSLGDWVWPRAELGLQSRRQLNPENGVDFTEHFIWTTDGHMLRQGMLTFELDDQGRLIDWTTPEHSGFLGNEWTYSYRDGRLVKSTFSGETTNGEPKPTAYHYDKGNNLSNITSYDDSEDAYDYSCW